MAAPVFLLLHGWGCESADMATLAEALSPIGPVAAVDLPGHGARAEQPAVGVADLARTTLADIDTLNPDGPIIIVGHSLGGAVALEAAVLAPDRIAAVVMLDSTWAAIAPTADVAARPVRGIDLEDRIDHLTLSRDAEHRAAGTPATGRPALDPDTLAEIFGDLMRWPGPGRLAACRVPVLALFADGHEAHVAAAAGVPGVRSQVVAGTSHFMQVRRPAGTARAIAHFLADLAATVTAGGTR